MTRRVLVVPLLAGVAVGLLGLVGLPLGCIAGLVALVALGAAYRDDAFMAGVFFGVPGVAVALVSGLATTPWLVVPLLIVGPVALYLSGVLARVGSALVTVAQPVAVPADVKPGSIAAVEAEEAIGRRRRGFILVIAFASLLIGRYALDSLFNDAADRRAGEARDDLIAATRDWTAADVVGVMSPDGGRQLPDVGWPISPQIEPLGLQASVRYGWAQRCVTVEVEGARRTSIRRGDCTGRVTSEP